ncbi:hypothetical protein HOA92_03975 [archaeon]|jgi:hypothetical protein|nr:hypothetical protein [archaeon]MBT6762171.1 hypothetical protein [archaeon]
MARGRPTKSPIRQNIIEILFYLKKGYGYSIYQIYNEIFTPVHIRSIYYHLTKGVNTGEILLDEIKEEKGDFSWGSKVEKIYYTLGPESRVSGNNKVAEYFRIAKEEMKADLKR